MSREPKILEKSIAISMIPKTKMVHTFRSNGFVLIGADWHREDLLKHINKYDCVIGGKDCRGMNHGLAIMDETVLFVECKKGINYSDFDETLLEVVK